MLIREKESNWTSCFVEMDSFGLPTWSILRHNCCPVLRETIMPEAPESKFSHCLPVTTSTGMCSTFLVENQMYLVGSILKIYVLTGMSVHIFLL